MLLDWTIDQDTNVHPSLLSCMQLVADLAPLAEKIRIPCFASVRLCNDDSIQKINREFRQMDRATDVLSFPAVAYPIGKTAGKCEFLLQREFDDEMGACFLGDIIISVPHLLAQAREYGHSDAREAAYLLVHGLCHLMGYDHMEQEDQKKMRKKEEEILTAAGLQRAESAVADDKTLLELAQEARKRSYSPYSGFSVGAALLANDGRIFQGCNIENASFGVTNCAERTALFKAVSEGARSFIAIAISAETMAWPCGVCRQALNEFAPELRVLVTDDQGHVEEKNLRELLPCSFGPKDLQNREY